MFLLFYQVGVTTQYSDCQVNMYSLILYITVLNYFSNEIEPLKTIRAIIVNCHVGEMQRFSTLSPICFVFVCQICCCMRFKRPESCVYRKEKHMLAWRYYRLFEQHKHITFTVLIRQWDYTHFGCWILLYCVYPRLCGWLLLPDRGIKRRSCERVDVTFNSLR
jgi:hypothetical protein